MCSQLPIPALFRLLLVPALLFSTAQGGAQSVAPSLDSARRGLAQYDLQGDATLDVIRGLGQLLEHPPGVREAREAAFLRDMAAADLLVLAPTPAMRSRVGAALGVPSTRVMAWLRADLARAAVGPYVAAARQGLDALALRDSATPDFGAASGPRRDALMLGAIATALQGDHAVGALAAMAPDPCATPDVACPPEYAHFMAPGRRAVAALRDARAAVVRIQQDADRGEPFARAASEGLPALVAALDEAVLQPAPRLPDDSNLANVTDADEAAPFDAVLLVDTRLSRLGYVARASVQADGTVVLEPAEVPLLPETQSFTLPAGYRPVVRAIPALVRELPEASESLRVALGVGPDVPAHVMSRVFLSARERGITPSVLLARGVHGGIRAMAFRGVLANEHTPTTDLRVHVRLGGYAVVSRSGASVSLPRVHGDDGLRFDVQGLSELVGQREPQSASLLFMSVVDSGPVLLAAFGLSPASDALTVVMP